MKTIELKEKLCYAPPKTQVTGMDVCQTLCTSLSDQTSESFIEEDYSNKW